MIEKVEQLKRKIASKDFNFTLEEKEYLKLYPELCQQIADAVVADESLWSKEVVDLFNYDILDSVVTTDKLLFLYAKYLIIYCDSYLTDIIEEARSIIQNEEYINTLCEIFKQKALSPDVHVDVTYINELLDEHDYDTIAQIKSYSISDRNQDIIERLNKEFPFDKYGVPTSLLYYSGYFIDHIEYFSINALLQIVDDYTIKDNSIKEKANNLLCQKMLTTHPFPHLENPEVLMRLIESNYFENKEIRDVLWDNHIYIDNDYLNNKLKENPNVVKEIVEAIKTNEESYRSLLANIKYSSYSTPCPLETNEDILDVYFEKGEIELFIRMPLSNPKREIYIHRLIDELKNGNTFYLNIVNKDPYIITKHNDLAAACLNIEGITEIPYDSTFEPNGPLYKEFLSFLENNSTTPTYIEKVSGVGINFEIGIRLLESKRYQSFGYYLQYAFDDFSELEDDKKKYLIERILEHLKTSDELAISIARYSQGIYKRFVFRNPQILKAIIEKNEIAAHYILQTLVHNEDLNHIYTDELFNTYRPYILNAYKIKEENLNVLVSKFGPLILKYLDNENITELLNLPLDQLEKIIAVFPNTSFEMSDMEAAYDAIEQYRFTQDYPEVIQIFPNILHSIEDNNQTYKKLIGYIAPYLDEKFFKRFEKKYEFNNHFKDNPLELLELIVDKIINHPEKREKYQNILHDITDYYIERRREEYRSYYHMYADIHMPFKVDGKSELNYVIDYCIKNYELIVDFLQKEISMYGLSLPTTSDELINFKQTVIERAARLGIESSLTIDVLNFLKDSTCQLTHDRSLVQKTIKDIKAIVKEIVQNNKHLITGRFFMQNIEAHREYDQKVKRNYYIEPRPTDIYRLLSLLRLDIIKDKLLPNEEMYQSLITCLQKRKLHLIPYCLESFINNLDIDIKFSEESVVAFINYYYNIYAKEKRIQQSNGISSDTLFLTLPSILKNSSVYSMVSSVYSQILGPEDAALIIANSAPNSATKKVRNNERLNEAVTWTMDNFARTEITVPPINEVISLNNKKMRCVVGNFTHPSNLTHGERTGACMRIGGVGESLFQFALSNPNGFHIRFEDPNTGKYISRVTGFRNGNTIFLNELRNSCDLAYTNQDVVDFCREVATLLVERSKDSTCPIDNVVIHRAYATQDMKEKDTILNVPSIKTGLPPFYSDVGTKAIILATSDPDNSLVPIDFDKKNVPTYEPVREQTIKTTNLDKIISTINRIHAINTYKQTNQLSNIDVLSFDDGFVFGMANTDWYIYVDTNNVVHEEILDFDKRALKELERARAIIEIARTYISKHQADIEELKEQLNTFLDNNIEQGSVNHGL